MPSDDLDYTDRYNTPLSPGETKDFRDWADDQSSKIGRNVLNDRYDYDIQGWWKQNGSQELTGSHLTDEFKKPNHPTFSTGSQYHGVEGNEGGEWGKKSDGSWFFRPGATNLKNFSPKDLNDYFKRVEPGNELKLPDIGPQQ